MGYSALNSIYRHAKKNPALLDFVKGYDSLSNLFEVDCFLDSERITLYKRIYEGVGGTPVHSVLLPNNNKLRIKAEYMNSMGNSHYSRYWIPYLFIAEALGVIVPGESHIIEVSSGSAGIALAQAGKLLGYKTSIIVPWELPPARIQPMEDFGANVIRVKGYIGECIQHLKGILSRPSSETFFPPNHSEEKSDILIHIYKRIGHELVHETGIPDLAVIGLGNGTSTYSIFKYLKSIGDDVKSITYFPGDIRSENIFGLYRSNVELRHVPLALDFTDETIPTEDIDLQQCREYFHNDTEIMNLGQSSMMGIGLAFSMALKTSGKNYFTIGYDKNDRY